MDTEQLQVVSAEEEEDARVIRDRAHPVAGERWTSAPTLAACCEGHQGLWLLRHGCIDDNPWQYKWRPVLYGDLALLWSGAAACTGTRLSDLQVSTRMILVMAQLCSGFGATA